MIYKVGILPSGTFCFLRFLKSLQREDLKTFSSVQKLGGVGIPQKDSLIAIVDDVAQQVKTMRAVSTPCLVQEVCGLIVFEIGTLICFSVCERMAQGRMKAIRPRLRRRSR